MKVKADGQITLMGWAEQMVNSFPWRDRSPRHQGKIATVAQHAYAPLLPHESGGEDHGSTGDEEATRLR